MDAKVISPLASLDAPALDLLFREARTFSHFQARPVADETLEEIARLAQLGPTEANALPGRFAFVKSPEARAKLLPLMAEGNREKTGKAPAVVIAAFDTAFYDMLPQTFPHADARSWYAGRPSANLRETALKSASLQAAYLILAARSLGLDSGPMAGFDADGIDTAFFAGTSWKSFMIINLGYGDRSTLFPRLPRLKLEAFTRAL